MRPLRLVRDAGAPRRARGSGGRPVWRDVRAVAGTNRLRTRHSTAASRQLLRLPQRNAAERKFPSRSPPRLDAQSCRRQQRAHRPGQQRREPAVSSSGWRRGGTADAADRRAAARGDHHDQDVDRSGRRVARRARGRDAVASGRSVGDAGARCAPARRSPESRAVAEGEPEGGARDGIRWHHAADVRRTLWRHAVGPIAARDGRGPERSQRCRRNRAVVGRGRSSDDATAARAPCRSERAIAGRPHAIAGGRRPCRRQRDRERAPRPRRGQGHGADRPGRRRGKGRRQGRHGACAHREEARRSASGARRCQHQPSAAAACRRSVSQDRQMRLLSQQQPVPDDRRGRAAQGVPHRRSHRPRADDENTRLPRELARTRAAGHRDPRTHRYDDLHPRGARRGAVPVRPGDRCAGALREAASARRGRMARGGGSTADRVERHRRDRPCAALDAGVRAGAAEGRVRARDPARRGVARAGPTDEHGGSRLPAPGSRLGR